MGGESTETNQCTKTSAQPATPIGLPKVRGLRELFKWALRRWRNVAVIAHLKSLGDYLLADVGLTLDWVSAVIGGPSLTLWQHPTDRR